MEKQGTYGNSPKVTKLTKDVPQGLRKADRKESSAILIFSCTPLEILSSEDPAMNALSQFCLLCDP